VEGLRLHDRKIIAALRAVRRHEFVPVEAAALAYSDEPVPLGIGDATASAAHMVALRLEAGAVRPGDRVLEIGGGMGYFAATAAEMIGPAGHVYTIELDARLAREAEQRLAAEGYSSRVSVMAGDGSRGLPEHAPYQAIFVSCAAPELLPAWKGQLADGGRLVAPIGSQFEQILVTYTRHGDRGETAWGPACRFVPLRHERTRRAEAPAPTTPHI